MNAKKIISSIRGHAASSVEAKRRRLEEDPISLDDLVQRLKQNQVKELNLGFIHSDFLHGKRYAATLEKALKQNYSVTSVSIGWRHSNRESLVKLLRAIARNTRLQHVKLILDDWVPVSVLNDLLQRQQKLITLDLQAVTVLSHNRHTGQWCCSPKSLREKSPQQEKAVNQWPPIERRSWELNQYSTKEEENHCDHSVITHCILQQDFGHHQNLKVLSLAECDLTDDRVISLADFLHLRGGLAELSLRNNRRLTGRGLKIICQAPVMKRLDMSLCDLEARDAKAIAEGIAARPWPVEEVVLAGNYRLDNTGLLAMTASSCCQKVVSLDMSYCDNKYYRSVLILNALSRLEETTSLRRLKLHGTFVSNDLVADALKHLLMSGTPLRSIQLNDPKDPKPMNANQLRTVLEGVQQSYEIEELMIDTLRSPQELEIWHEIDFSLRLNMAGRRILRTHEDPIDYQGFPVAPADDWFEVLEKAGVQDENLEVLFWIVREGADHFCERERSLQQSR